jgi:hydroxyacylglutathione hydrolase
VIIDTVVVSPFASNCYIIGSEATRKGMIIDPGDDADRIMEAVNRSGLDIKCIVVTHGHLDHLGALKEVREETGAEVCIHADDSKFIQEEPVETIFGARYPSLSPPDRLLREGDTIDVGGLHFRVINILGHTRGSICLLGHGALFTGDTLFNYGIGRTDFPGGSQSQLVNHINKKMMVLPDSTIIYPGHGPKTTIGTERRANPFLRGV